MIFGNTIFGITYQERPAAYVVITDEGGRIAAVKGKRGYFLPGGGSLPDETPEETIKRELREELAREVEITKNIGEVIQYFSAGDGHYKMKATFYKAAFTSERQGEAEHELYWIGDTDVAETFFHECHKWAVNQIKH